MKYPKKLTPWFQGSVKPVRNGIYQRIDTKGRTFFSKWDGEFWCAYASSFYLAETFTQASKFQDWDWRGLAQDPSEGGAA